MPFTSIRSLLLPFVFYYSNSEQTIAVHHMSSRTQDHLAKFGRISVYSRHASNGSGTQIVKARNLLTMHITYPEAAMIACALNDYDLNKRPLSSFTKDDFPHVFI